MRRVSYDADTSQYTFTDAQGQAYTGPPGSTYGVLKPVPDPYTQVLKERPEAFADTGNVLTLLYFHSSSYSISTHLHKLHHHPFNPYPSLHHKNDANTRACFLKCRDRSPPLNTRPIRIAGSHLRSQNLPRLPPPLPPHRHPIRPRR